LDPVVVQLKDLNVAAFVMMFMLYLATIFTSTL